MLLPWSLHANLQSAKWFQGQLKKPLLEKGSVGQDLRLLRWTLHTFLKLMFKFFLSHFLTVIEHHVSVCFGCGTIISSTWSIINWTFLSGEADFSGGDRCFHNGRKCEFYPWYSLGYFPLTSWFTRLSNLYLIICHDRHLLRKYPCKSRGLAVHLLTTIPLTLGTVPLLILILLIPKFGIHLMVRKLCAGLFLWHKHE